MNNLIAVRAQARQDGKNTFVAVREYLEGLGESELDTNLAELISCKSKRPKKRENKIKEIVARICQGDAFLS